MFEVILHCDAMILYDDIESPPHMKKNFILFPTLGILYSEDTKFKTNADVYFHSLSHITLQAKENEEKKDKRVIQFSDDLLCHVDQ